MNNQIKSTDQIFIPSLVINNEYAVVQPNSLTLVFGKGTKNVEIGLAGSGLQEVSSIDYSTYISVLSGKLLNTTYNINKASQWIEESNNFGLDIYLRSLQNGASISILKATWCSDIEASLFSEGTFDFTIKGVAAITSGF